METSWMSVCDECTNVGDGDTVLHKIQKSIEDEYPSTSREGGRGGRGGGRGSGGGRGGLLFGYGFGYGMGFRIPQYTPNERIREQERQEVQRERDRERAERRERERAEQSERSAREREQEPHIIPTNPLRNQAEQDDDSRAHASNGERRVAMYEARLGNRDADEE